MSAEIAEHTSVTVAAVRQLLRHRPRPPVVSPGEADAGRGLEQPHRPGRAPDLALAGRRRGPGRRLRLPDGLAGRVLGSHHRDLTEPTTIPLYATRLDVDADTSLELVVAGRATWSAVLRFLDDPETDVVGTDGRRRRPAGSGCRPDRSRRTRGARLIRVGVRLEGSGDVDVRLGELLLGPGPALLLRAPRHPVAKRSRPGYRVYWRGQPGVRYDLEAVNPDETRSWLGATTRRRSTSRPLGRRRPADRHHPDRRGRPPRPAGFATV